MPLKYYNDVKQIRMLVELVFQEGWRVTVQSAHQEIGVQETYQQGGGNFGCRWDEWEELSLVRIRESAGCCCGGM